MSEANTNERTEYIAQHKVGGFWHSYMYFCGAPSARKSIKVYRQRTPGEWRLIKRHTKTITTEEIFV